MMRGGIRRAAFFFSWHAMSYAAFVAVVPRRTPTWTLPSKTTTMFSSASNSGKKEGSSSNTPSSSSGSSGNSDVSVENIIRDNYPDFYNLLSANEGIFEQLATDYGGENQEGYTLFVPTAEAFGELGDKKRLQLRDPRNLETTQKMGLYHVIVGEQLSLTKLNREDWTVPKTPEGLPALKFEAMETLGGKVPIGRTKAKKDGNFWSDLFGREKESVTDENGEPATVIIIGPSARILRSLRVGNALIHEVDDLISPLILFRYFDQLRLPGL